MNMLKKISVFIMLLSFSGTNLMAQDNLDLLNDLEGGDDTQQEDTQSQNNNETTDQNNNQQENNQNQDNDETANQQNDTQEQNQSQDDLEKLDFYSTGDKYRIPVVLLEGSNFVVEFKTSEKVKVIKNVGILDSNEKKIDLGDVKNKINLLKVGNSIKEYSLRELQNSGEEGIVVNPDEEVYLLGELNQQERQSLKQKIGGDRFYMDVNLPQPKTLGKLINRNNLEIDSMYGYSLEERGNNETVETTNNETDEKEEVKKQDTGLGENITIGLFVLFLITIIGYYFTPVSRQ